MSDTQLAPSNQAEGEKTTRGVGRPREKTILGVAADPNVPRFKPREATVLGVGDSARPAEVQLALDSSASGVGVRPALPFDPNVTPPPIALPTPAPLAAMPARLAPVRPRPAAVPAAPMPPRRTEQRPAARPQTAADSDIHPAGVPRSGIFGKLLLVLAIGMAVAGYLKRDVVMDEVARRMPSFAMSVGLAPSVAPEAPASAPGPAKTKPAPKPLP